MNYIQNTYDLNESLFGISFRYLRETEKKLLTGSLLAIKINYPLMMEFLILMPVLMRHHYCEIYISNDEHLRHKYNLPAISYRKGKVLRVKEPLQGNYRPGKLRG